ncbi:MAG: helix-turn-helix transcriptional regulator [Nanoarchaeota archaeon]|nr:helix-turn-helix transcriptional regulator [Nanoarchaeota archaeon]
MKNSKAAEEAKYIKEQVAFCKRIKAIRIKQKRTKIDVAVEAELNPNYYGRIERGLTGIIRFYTLDKIREALGVKWVDILGPNNPIVTFLEETNDETE